MRVLFVADCPLPSSQTASHLAAEIAQGIIDAGQECDIVCPAGESISGVSFQGYYDMNAPVTVHRIGSSPEAINSLFFRYRYLADLTSFLAEHGAEYDVLYTLSSLALPALVQSGRPTIMEVMTLPPRGHKKFFHHLKQCLRVVAGTHALRTVLLDAGLTTTPIVVEGGAINARRFSGVSDDASLRLTYGISESVPVVGFVGPFNRPLAIAALSFALDGLALLAERGLEFSILAIGASDEDTRRLEASTLPSLRGKLLFTGLLPYCSVPRSLSLCSVGVIAASSKRIVHTFRDSIPLAAYEWMAAGIPVLLPDTSPMRDQFTDRSAAFYRVGDRESLAQAVRDMLVDNNASLERAKNAVADVSVLLWQTRMSRILGIFEGAREATL